jgi:quinol monooxygenase YgiN
MYQKEDAMYGTIARIKIADGKEAALLDHMKQYEAGDIAPGFVASAFYRADAGGGECWMAVVFESKEAYRANAESPEQDARYQEFRSFLTADPEWHDGEVLRRTTR